MSVKLHIIGALLAVGFILSGPAGVSATETPAKKPVRESAAKPKAPAQPTKEAGAPDQSEASNRQLV